MLHRVSTIRSLATKVSVFVVTSLLLCFITSFFSGCSSSATTNPGATWAGTNYMTNSGSGNGNYYTGAPTDGVFYANSILSFNNISDGTSNTMFMSETLRGPGPNASPTPPNPNPSRQPADYSTICFPSTTTGTSCTSPYVLSQLCAGTQSGTIYAYDGDRAVSWIYGNAVLPRIFREFLRWQTLCDERRVAANGSVHVAAILPELVPAALPVRLRDVPLRGRLARDKTRA